MATSLIDLVSRIDPETTVLFFGSGSSIPSGAPSVDKIKQHFSKDIVEDYRDYTLSELASLYEYKFSRQEMIEKLRELFRKKSPTGGLLNLPLHSWKGIYTTNYDNLIEEAYKNKGVEISSISSNFDFGLQKTPEGLQLFKLHGSIDKDICDGSNSRVIISEEDYELTSEYREALYAALNASLFTSHLVIIGYSLSDSHIKELINSVLKVNSQSHSPCSVYLLLYEKDDNRATLYEKKGIKVVFGGIDDFFSELHKRSAPTKHVYSSTGDPLDISPVLRPLIFDVAHEVESGEKDASAMFNGWPASYSDIAEGLTFSRTLSKKISYEIDESNILCSVLLGASGTGKTTLSKQIMYEKNRSGFYCWEHKVQQTLLPDKWVNVAKKMDENNEKGFLFIDEAHLHILEINDLVDFLVVEECFSLKIILVSSRHLWEPRSKSANIFKYGFVNFLKSLDEEEINSLLVLIDSNQDLKPLVEDSFSGFSRQERKRRLVVRCESDTFVCLKNIFSSEKFDDIILREYACLDESCMEIYKLVAAMESSGINVHRQLVIRLLSISAEGLSCSLSGLADIIHEYTISERDGIYGWKGRHPVITGIIAKYKMNNLDEYYELYEKVIKNINPSYDVEIRTIRQLCGFEKGIGRLRDIHKRNKLLREMISKVPGERVPRHRLIRNLIDLNEVEKADTEIRLFENDFTIDAPVTRYKIKLLLSRAENTIGILEEDREVILDHARLLASNASEKYSDNKDVLRTYCDVGIEIFKKMKDMSVFDDAMDKLRAAGERVGDPQISRIVTFYENKISGYEYADSVV